MIITFAKKRLSVDGLFWLAKNAAKIKYLYFILINIGNRNNLEEIESGRVDLIVGFSFSIRKALIDC